MSKEIIKIKAPKESTEWDIDDFLGNAFQYKLNEKWYYDTSINLPNSDLCIINIQEVDNHKIIWIEVNKLF